MVVVVVVVVVVMMMTMMMTMTMMPVMMMMTYLQHHCAAHMQALLRARNSRHTRRLSEHLIQSLHALLRQQPLAIDSNGLRRERRVTVMHNDVELEDSEIRF